MVELRQNNTDLIPVLGECSLNAPEKYWGPGLATILEKNDWDTLSDLGEKETHFPRRNVDMSHVVRSLARSPNIDLMGAGKDYGKSQNPSAFY